MRFADRIAGSIRALMPLGYGDGGGNPPPGYGGWGAGPGPTGKSDSPTAPGIPRFGGVKGLAGTTNVCRQYLMILAATGVVQGMQYGLVPPGHTVLVRGHNGTAMGGAGGLGGNVAPIRIAKSPESLSVQVGGYGSGQTITPDTEVVFPVDNLCEIFAVGTAGDGLIITVQQQRV